MNNMEQIKNTVGSYESTITFIESNGYGENEYRVKVAFNNGENMSFLKGYSTLKQAHRAAARELKKVL